MDVTTLVGTLGGLLVGLGAVGTGVATYVGKRGENTTTRLNTTMDQIQEERTSLREERDKYRAQVTERDAQIIDLQKQHAEDLVEIARLQIKIMQLGGEP